LFQQIADDAQHGLVVVHDQDIHGLIDCHGRDPFPLILSL
jgi:hypothetical protein